MKSAYSLSACALLLSGCMAIGPSWKRPQPEVPAQFRGASAEGAALSAQQWQQVLHDPDLQQLLQEVFDRNGSLAAMQHNVDAACHYTIVAAAPIFPWLGYGGSTTKGMNSSGGQVIAHGTSKTSNPGSMQLSASWELDLWGKYLHGVEAAVAEAYGAHNTLGALRLLLMRQVACGYLQLLMLDEELGIQQAAAESYRESLQLFEYQEQGGVADRLQTASASAALAAAEAQIPMLQTQIASMENTLSALAGRAPGSIRRGRDLMSMARGAKVAAGLPADMLARRPDIRAKEEALRSANAEVGVAIASYFPIISLTGAMGYASADLRRAQFGKHSGWGIGADLTGPLFQAGRLRGNELMKRDAFLAAKAEYEQSVLDALAEVSTTLIQRQKLQTIISKQEQAVAAAQERVHLSMERYRQGMAGYYEVLDAQKSLFPAQRQLAEYRYQYAACVPTLYTQLGGGWE